jgi:hypothetical protein
MAENLRRLVSNESLRVLQEKLNAWMRDYNVSPVGELGFTLPHFHAQPRLGSRKPLGLASEKLLCKAFRL